MSSMKGDSLLLTIITQIMLRTVWFVIGAVTSAFVIGMPFRRQHTFITDEYPYFIFIYLAAILLAGVLGAAFGPVYYTSQKNAGRGKLKEIRQKSMYRIRRKKPPEN